MLKLLEKLDEYSQNNRASALLQEKASGDNAGLPDEKCTRLLLATKQIDSIYNLLVELTEFNHTLDNLLSYASAYYWFFKDLYSISRVPKNKGLLEGIKKYEYLKSKSFKFTYGNLFESIEEHSDWCVNPGIRDNASFDSAKACYFQRLCNVQQNCLVSFMSEDAYLYEYHCTEAYTLIHRLQGCALNEIEYSKQRMLHFFSNTEDALITELIRVYIEVRQSHQDAENILKALDYLSEKYKDAVSYFEEKCEESLNVNFNKLNKLLGSLRPNTATNECTELSSSEFIPAELENSLDKILEFSCIPYEKIDFFKQQLALFKKMENKDKLDLMPLEVRKSIAAVFFEIYENVFQRVLKENVNDKAIDMFLIFGLIDNSLLTNRQTIALANLLDLYNENGNVFSMKQWLTKIYHREKSPSLTELGVDYEQMLREKTPKSNSVANSTISPEDSGDHRLSFEIMNMLKTTHKLCFGQSSKYLPFLHSDMLPEDITRVAMTIKKVKQSIQNILDIDFSAFYREVFYTGDDPAFKKEFVMKQVMPDILLIPTFGTKMIMWQEISGRSKLSPGRFLVPIFTWEDIDNMFIKLVGIFRWEICRSVMGMRWNDISYKSLTSEYADYIQSYKRNKNLSQENREKIKMKIQRHHNSLRDIFSSDYEEWIKYEAKGIQRVNKEVRSILYKNCPFSRALRNDLAIQPAFSNVGAQFENERRKYAKELENRYANYLKQGHTLEPELEENLRYYTEL